MFERLPDWFDPFEYVDKKRSVSGVVPLNRMDRLRDVLLSSDGEARIDLEFRREGSVAAISGRVEADLVLRCQCCLGPLEWSVRNEVHLGVVGSIDEAGLLSEAYEPLVVGPGDAVALVDIVQDELLLDIPSIPQHSDCRLPKPEAASDEAEHPFAALAQLKKDPSFRS